MPTYAWIIIAVLAGALAAVVGIGLSILYTMFRDI
jgi:hypothetical protein